MKERERERKKEREEEQVKQNSVTYLSLSKVWWLYGRVLLWQVKSHVLHKPSERSALEFLSKFLLFADVTRLDITIMRSSLV
jgi:hypothetical protein